MLLGKGTMSIIKGKIIRGGTSRALFLLEEDIKFFFKNHHIEFNKTTVTALIRYLMGAQDETRIDGVGGTLSHTSKAVVIRKSTQASIDVEFDFYQISLEKDLISSVGTCGNISSAVGVFALSENLLDSINEPITIIRIYDTNTKTILEQHIPIHHGSYDNRVLAPSHFNIPGVTYGAGKIITDYKQSIGAYNGMVLPTGKTTNLINTEKGPVTISVVDAVNICVFINEIDFLGHAVPLENDNVSFTRFIQEIRGKVAEQIGMVKRWQDIDHLSPLVPLVVILKHKESSVHSSVNISVVAISLNKIHHSIPASAAICLAAAAKIPDTLPFVMSGEVGNNIIISHPSGVVEVVARKDRANDFVELSFQRTARILMEGTLEVNMEIFRSNCLPESNKKLVAKL